MLGQLPVEILWFITKNMVSMVDVMELSCVCKHTAASLVQAYEILAKVLCNQVGAHPINSTSSFYRSDRNSISHATSALASILTTTKKIPEDTLVNLILCLVIRERADVHYKQNLAIKALIERNKVNALRQLVEQGTDISGHPGLIFSLVKDPKKADMLSLFLTHIPPPFEALQVAVQSRNLVATSLILDARTSSSSPSFAPINVNLLLKEAVQTHESDTILLELLLAYPDSSSPTHYDSVLTVLTMSSSHLRLLVNRCRLDPREHGSKVLYNMVKDGDFETVMWLLDDLKLKPKKVAWEHALWLASSYGKSREVEEFLKRGVSPNSHRTGHSSGVLELRMEHLEKARNRVRFILGPRRRRQRFETYYRSIPIGVPADGTRSRVRDVDSDSGDGEDDEDRIDMDAIEEEAGEPAEGRASGHSTTTSSCLTLGSNTQSPLAEASARGHVDVVRLLVQAGATVPGDHAVTQAAMQGHQEIVDILLEAGADRAMERRGRLVYMASTGNLEGVRECLREEREAGGYVGTAFRLGRLFAPKATPVKCSVTDQRIATYMNEAALMGACRSGKAEIVHLLIQAGANVHARLNEALCIVTELGFVDIATLLLDSGVDVNLGYPSPCSMAARRGHTELLKLYLSRGAKIEGLGETISSPTTHTRDKSQFTKFLCDVIEQGRALIIKLLLDQPEVMKAYLEDAFGIQDCMIAAFASKKLSVVRLLLDYGADPETRRLWMVFEQAAAADRKLACEWDAMTGTLKKFDEEPVTWQPSHGFLHEIIHHPKRDHVMVVTRLVASGATETARSWAARHGVIPSVVDVLMGKRARAQAIKMQLARQSSLNKRRAANKNTTTTPKPTFRIYGRDESMDKMIDDNGQTEQNLKDTMSINNHDTIIEHAATWCGTMFFRALMQAGEPFAHGGARAFAKAVIRGGAAGGTAIMRLLNVSELNLYDGIRAACYLGKLSTLQQLIEVHGVRVGKLGGERSDSDRAFRLGKGDSAISLKAAGKRPFCFWAAEDWFVDVPGAVMAAVRGKRENVLKYLLADCGLHPDGVPNSFEDAATPLRVAVTYGSTEMVRLLLKHGASARKVPHMVLWAVRSGVVDILQMALKAGANPCGPVAARLARTTQGKHLGPSESFDSTHAVADFGGGEEFGCDESEEEDFAVMLDDEKAWGLTKQECLVPLVNATRRGNLEMVQLLIAAGAEVDECDGIALCAATRMQDSNLIKAIKVAGASIKGEYRGLLMLQIDANSTEGVRETLELNRSLTASAVLLTRSRTRDSTPSRKSGDVFVSASTGSVLSTSSSHSENPHTKHLLETPLLALGEGEAIRHAAFKDRTEILQLLLKEPGVRVDWKDHEALINAAANDSVACVRLLLAHGADATAQDSQAFFTALYSAGNEDVVVELLKAGADVKAQNGRAKEIWMSKRMKRVIRRVTWKSRLSFGYYM